MLTAPIWGRLSDRVGRPPGADGQHGRRLARLSVAGLRRRAVDAVSRRGRWPGPAPAIIAAANAYVADVTTPENRAKGMGMIGAAFGLGFIVGPALGGIVAGNQLRDRRFAQSRSHRLRAVGNGAAGRHLRAEGEPARGRCDAGRVAARVAALRDALGRKALARLLAVFFSRDPRLAGMEATFALWAMAQFGWGPRRSAMSSPMSACCRR